MEKTIEILLQLIIIVLLALVLVAALVMGWFGISLMYHTLKWELMPELTDQTVPEIRKKSNSFRHRFLARFRKKAANDNGEKSAAHSGALVAAEEEIEYV